MPFRIIRDDITKLRVDAIVSNGNSGLEERGGVSGQIFRAAGPRMAEACGKLGGCAPGEVVVTPGFDLPAKYVIHTVGPRWQGGGDGEEHILKLCYKNILRAARERGLESVASPLIASGSFGYPKRKAIEAASGEIQSFLSECDEMEIILVLFGQAAVSEGDMLFSDIERRIDDYYAEQRIGRRRGERTEYCSVRYDGITTLSEALNPTARPFKELFYAAVNESGLSNSEIYGRANITRQVYSSIFNRENYTPTKNTVLALCVSLRLDISRTNELLASLGYAFSDANVADRIVRYCIGRGGFNVFDINMILYDASTGVQLGARA